MSGSSEGLLAPGERKTAVTSTKSPNPRPRTTVRLSWGFGDKQMRHRGLVGQAVALSAWPVCRALMANGARINVCLGL